MSAWLLPAVLLSSGLPAILVFLLPEPRQRTRAALSLGGAALKLVLLGLLLVVVARGEQVELRFALVAGFDVHLRADTLALLFATLSAVLWLVTTVYVIGYFHQGQRRRRFYGFFNLCVSATTGVAFAGNPLTFLLFYEALTLSTWPLVVHWGDEASLRAGRVYLAYTLTGGAVLFVATAWVHVLAGPFAFTPGGALGALGEDPRLVWAFALFLLGLGVKTAIAPLHGWLPTAMVAPAPVSALLHAVAVVKAGAFGVVRVAYEVFGIALCDRLGVLLPLALVASATIVFGAIKALQQEDLKRLLAYSTVSQVSYIVLGVSLFGPAGTLGGLVHLVHQGIMKITLFFCAGILSSTLGVKELRRMGGTGRRMPLTMGAFTVAALGMMGVPPLAGFVSKWHLGLGALEAGRPWAIAVLLSSTLINAAFFFPVLRAVWFAPRRGQWPRDTLARGRLETTPWLLVPALVTAGLTILLGVFAAAPVGVRALALQIVFLEIGP
jgi:multicomponent Na+:H+ antiporter subunit D